MKVGLLFNKLLLVVCATFLTHSLSAQFLVDMIDTTDARDKGLWAVYRKSDHLQISGYFQPQFQATQSKGAKNYSGGDFSAHSDNRFIIRRGRVRFDYAHFNQAGLPQAQVVFQFEGSERGVAIRDFWGRYYENKLQLFSFTAGMFARPFGYEVNLASIDRESPERGRMSQVLMRTERDLGAMVTLEPRKKQSPLRLIKIDAGIFNGQGLTGPEEYDDHKDFIARLGLKPYNLSRLVSFSGGLSFFHGGLAVDTSGKIGPRRYRGADAQLKVKNRWGKTELRGEYWWGRQTGGAQDSNTPGTLLTTPYYIRDFNGAFFYLLQNVVSEKHLVALKYDIYDPNRHVARDKIGASQSDTHPGDIRYNTFGFGYIFFPDSHIKLMLWYDIIKNERTALTGYTSDIKDNVFTFRTQFRF